MSKAKKTALIISGIMIAAGLLLTFIAFIGIHFDFSKLSTVKMSHQTYTIEESFSSINVDCAEGNVRFVPSDNNICEVRCAEEDSIIHSVEVSDDTLTVIRTDNREWYEFIGIYWYDEDVELTISLPESSYEKLSVQNLSGDIFVPADIKFSDVKLISASGDISCMAGVSGNMNVTSTSGDVTVVNADASALAVKSTSGDIMVASSAVEGELSVKSTSGDIAVAESSAANFSAVCTSGDTELMNTAASGEFNVKTVSGDIELNRCDGGSIAIKSTSGDISGTLISEKMFSVHTTSGNMNVPDDSGTEKCEITTTSGDVKIRIEK